MNNSYIYSKRNKRADWTKYD